MRFETAEQAKAFLDSKPDGKMVIEGKEAALKQLEGEDEVAYIEKVCPLVLKPSLCTPI